MADQSERKKKKIMTKVVPCFLILQALTLTFSVFPVPGMIQRRYGVVNDKKQKK